VQGRESLLEDIAAKMTDLTFTQEKSEILPDTKASRTRETFPYSCELDDALVRMVRPLFQPVLEEWKESHRELNIPLDFTEDEVSSMLVVLHTLIDVLQTWSKKCIRRSVNRMLRKEGMRDNSPNFG
jgi:hypothetical protein